MSLQLQRAEVIVIDWENLLDLNLRPKAYESSALPLSYSGTRRSERRH